MAKRFISLFLFLICDNIYSTHQIHKNEIIDISNTQKGFFFIVRTDLIINKQEKNITIGSIVLEAYEENGSFKKDFNNQKPLNLSSQLSIFETNTAKINDMFLDGDIQIKAIPFKDNAVLILIYDNINKLITINIYDEYGNPIKAFNNNFYTLFADLTDFNISNAPNIINIGIDPKGNIWLCIGENLEDNFGYNYITIHVYKLTTSEELLKIQEKAYLNIKNDRLFNLNLLNFNPIKFENEHVLISGQFLNETPKTVEYLEGYILLNEKNPSLNIFKLKSRHLITLAQQDMEILTNSENKVDIISPYIHNNKLSKKNISNSDAFFLDIQKNFEQKPLNPNALQRERILDDSEQLLKNLIQKHIPISPWFIWFTNIKVFKTHNTLKLFVWLKSLSTIRIYYYDLKTLNLMKKQELLLGPIFSNPSEMINMKCKSIFKKYF